MTVAKPLWRQAVRSALPASVDQLHLLETYDWLVLAPSRANQMVGTVLVDGKT